MKEVARAQVLRDQDSVLQAGALEGASTEDRRNAELARHQDLVFPSSLIGIIEQKQWRTFKFSLKNVGEMPGGKQETKVFFFCVFSPTIFFLMFFVFVVFVSFRRCGFCVLINVVA